MKTLSALVALSLLVGCSDPTGGGKMTVQEYANGQLKSRGYIKGNNVRTGEWTFWHENGQRASEGQYVDHQKEGPWTYWWAHGGLDPRSSGIYKDDKKVADLPK